MKYVAIFLVLMALLARGQNVAQDFADRFNAYQIQRPATEVELVLNQDKYAPGDTIFFKIYFVTADQLRVAGKELIEIDLVGREGSIQHVRAMVEDGSGYNQLVIPADAQPGFFLVTAYSNWMRNFGMNSFFRKQIEIVGAKQVVTAPAYPIHAVVEGGNLIEGIKNRIVAKGTPGAIAEIVDDKQDVIATAQLDEKGFGSTWMVPKLDASYAVRVGASSVILPVLKSGWTLRLNHPDQDADVQLIAKTPRRSDLAKQIHCILLTGQGKVFFAVQFLQGEQDSVVINLPKNGIGNGLVHASLLNQAGDLLASRDFYKRGNNTVNAIIQTSANEYETRSKVTATVTLQDQQGNLLSGDFSVAVLNASVFRDDVAEEMAPDVTKSDDFMVLNTTPVNWKSILEGVGEKPIYAFRNTIQRTGIARVKTTGEPLPMTSVLMFYLQRQSKVFQTVTLDGGRFGLSMSGVTGVDELFYMAQTARGMILPEIEINWDNDEVPLPRPIVSTESSALDTYGRFVQNKRAIENSYRAYGQSLDTANTIRPIDRFDLSPFGGADVVVDLSSYISFPSMAELLKEVVPSVLHRRRNDQSIVRVRLDPPNAYSPLVVATDDPVYIIDGVATRNTDFFLSLKPADLRSIKVLKNPPKLARFGVMGKNGLVIVESKLGLIREPLSPDNLQVGVNKPQAFGRLNGTDSFPVFKSTIDWIPTVRVEGQASFSFSLTDDVGEILILIRGRTDQGMPFSGNHIIRVTNHAK